MDVKKKNLLLMVPMLHQGGFERVCVQTARLMQRYYNVHILIFSSKDINYDVTGIDVIDIDVPSKKGLFNKVINVLKRANKVRSIKKKYDIDLSYSFGSSANYVNVLSRAQEKVLTGLRCQTDMESPKQVRLFCNKADQVLSCSREIMRELKRDYDYEKSSFIYNPLDTKMIREKAKGPEADEFKKLCEGKGPVLISVGRQDYIKGFWHLIKAFSLVTREHEDARLLIVGTGDFSRFKTLANDLGIGDKVIFTGLQKNPFPFVEMADMYVLSSNHEGFPNALIEAMALGKPCVAADCKTGPREILLSDEEYQALIQSKPDGSSTDDIIDGEYGIIVPDMDEHEDFDASNITSQDKKLAEGILRMLSDRDKMARYGEKAYERALSYEPSKYAVDLYGILERV